MSDLLVIAGLLVVVVMLAAVLRRTGAQEAKLAKAEVLEKIEEAVSELREFTNVSCGLCSGKGEVFKSAMGWGSDHAPCDACAEAGVVRVPAPATQCGRCQGRGWVHKSGGRFEADTGICPGCKGSGWFGAISLNTNEGAE